MEFIVIAISALLVYVIYALISSKIIISMRRDRAKNKCKYCPHSLECDPSNPKRVCNWNGDDSK